MKTRNPRRKRFAFTLIELLVVIAIIGVLAAFLLPAIAKAQAQARKATCKSQLHQFAIAVKTYHIAFDGNSPPWLSNLYPNFVKNPKLYLCPSDPTEGTDGGKPFWEGVERLAFKETDDFFGSEASGKDPEAAAVQNGEIKGNSYLYEICCAECSWWNDSYSWNSRTCTFADNYVPDPEIHSGRAVLTWREVKEWEAKVVGPWTPMIRCFWHTGGSFAAQDQVVNVGMYTYHIYLSDTTGEGWMRQGNQ